MKAIAQLLFVYFAGTRLQRWVTGPALALMAFAMLGMLGFLPGSERPWMTLGGQYWVFALVAMLALVLGGSLLPVVFGRFALGHHLSVLPHGRVKLVASALGGIALVALVCAGGFAAAFAQFPADHLGIFRNSLFGTFMTFSLMYVAVWFVSRARSATGMLGGALLVMVCLALPLRLMSMPHLPIRWIAAGAAAIYGVCIALFLLAPRLGNLSGWRKLASLRATSRGEAQYPAGREVELIVGTAQPWLLALGQAFPILLATPFIGVPSMWLFYFALCSVISGAMASVAAARTRALWLRARWSREQLFAPVEAAFLRQNVRSVSVLILLLIVIGTYRELPASLLALGIALLVVGTLASTYLGLMMTKGIGWLDSILAIGTMGLMMAAAVYAAADERALVIALEVLLAVLALGFRAGARRRWRQLDWTLCRSVTVAHQ